MAAGVEEVFIFPVTTRGFMCCYTRDCFYVWFSAWSAHILNARDYRMEPLISGFSEILTDTKHVRVDSGVGIS